MSSQAQCGLAGSKRRKNAREQETTVFGFNFDWLRQGGARSFSKSQSEQNKTITFETHLKIAAKIENTFMGKMLGRKGQWFLTINHFDWFRERGASHKESKIRLLLSKLSWKSLQKLKTNLREKFSEKMEIVFFTINYHWFRERGASSFKRITKQAK